jgi:hypothetical protein
MAPRVNREVLARDRPRLEKDAKVADDVGPVRVHFYQPSFAHGKEEDNAMLNLPDVEVRCGDLVLVEEMEQSNTWWEGTVILRHLERSGTQSQSRLSSSSCSF